MGVPTLNNGVHFAPCTSKTDLKLKQRIESGQDLLVRTETPRTRTCYPVTQVQGMISSFLRCLMIIMITSFTKRLLIKLGQIFILSDKTLDKLYVVPSLFFYSDSRRKSSPIVCPLIIVFFSLSQIPIRGCLVFVSCTLLSGRVR